MNINEYSFCSLFGKHTASDGKQFEIKEIEIPIIQRDYAQGRKNDAVSRVRERFLDTILDAVNNNHHLTLDFVYGEIENGKLIPLDGQQRLTTMFLLHWYASKKECISEEKCAFLKKFTYYTRPSSRVFCERFVEHSPEFNCTISEEIVNQSWFQYQWLNDPTINGMLVMIDAIHAKFNAVTNLWQKLVDDQCVTFYFLPITEMGLTDELYIKMNSRGKPLTPFEHFKAEFEGMIREYDVDISNEINKKFDLNWTDMLFPYRGDNNIIDEEFMRYFRFVSDLLYYQKGKSLESDEFKLAKSLYGKENPEAHDNLVFLKNAFDCWCGFDIDEFFDKHFSGNVYQSGKTKISPNIVQDTINLFKQCCDDYGEYLDSRRRKFPLYKTLLLYAVLVYLENKESITETGFQRRIRIIRNLIMNSSDEIRADAQRNNMPMLLQETKEIMLTGVIPHTGAYNQKQREEEMAKEDWLIYNPQYSDELFHLEDHNLLYGCVSVVGLEHPENFKKFRELFNNCSKQSISRALLSYGDYSQSLDWRWQMGTSNERNLSTWQDLFHPSNKRKGFENTKAVLNAMLSSIDVFSDYVLEEVIEGYLANPEVELNWRYYFVKYPEMLSDTYGMYYSFKDGIFHTLKMHTAERLNGRHWNVFNLAIHNATNNTYTLGEYGDKLHISDELSLDCLNDKFVLYRRSVEDNEEYAIEEYPLPSEKPFMDENGIDMEDRVEYGVRLVNQIVPKIDDYFGVSF
ncbi:MAG: DUF262 domain-containing protein [Bacteroidales bacterium]|nr:DUF262 domain-containing protein [Bacteroidales bacterium]MBR5081966.1 DUF262 domain-containing protein [Bacteroidales bacterium]